MRMILAWKAFVREVAKVNDPLLSSIFQQGLFVHYDASEKKLEVAFAKDLNFFHDKIIGSQNAWMPILRDSFKAELQFVPAYNLEKKIAEPVVVARPTAALPRVATAQPVQAKPVQRNVERGNQPPAKGGWQQKSQSSYQGANNRNNFQKDTFTKPRGALCNVSDKDVWIKANLLLQHFPGTVYEMQRVNNEQA